MLTDDDDIREAIKQPIEYAIYCALLEIRNPEKWLRIFRPGSTHPVPPHFVNAPLQHRVHENSLIWLARKFGRFLRFILAVPDDPDLKTYSSRYPPPINTVACQPQIGIVGPIIPSRPVHTKDSTLSRTPPNSLRSNIVPARPARPERISSEQFRPNAQDALAMDWFEPTRVNDNTTFTGVTLASPLNHRIMTAPRQRGYDQDAFVTVLNPSVDGSKAGSKMSESSAGKRDKEYVVKDGESAVTKWPLPEY